SVEQEPLYVRLGRSKSPVFGSMTQSSPVEISNQAPWSARRPLSSRIFTHGKVRRLAIWQRIEIRSSAVWRSDAGIRLLPEIASAAGATIAIHLPMKSPGER